MNIVHIAESFAGGTLDFLIGLTNGLPENNYLIVHGKRNNTPADFRSYFPSKTEFYHWEKAGREISPFKDIIALIDLFNILKKHRHYDVIHLHSSKAGFLGRLACRALRIHDKVIYTSHGASFLRKDVSKTSLKLYIYLEKIGAKLGGRVVACSKSECNEFLKHGISASWIYNGVNCRETATNSLPQTDFVIGTIGRITYAKNPSLFDKIAKEFINRSNVRFLWIGDGELKNDLSSTNIEITGWLSQDDMENRLQNIDLYLSTSLWEGLPLSVLQAMCAGKPLLLSDCVGNRDLVSSEDGCNGFLFKEMAEAVLYIERLMNDSNERKKMSNRSRQLVMNVFSLKQTIVSYADLYKQSAHFIGN